MQASASADDVGAMNSRCVGGAWHSSPAALVAVVDSGDPTTIYYSGREGWHFPRNFGGPVSQGSEAIRELEALRREGARYLVFLRDTRWWLDHYVDFEGM